MWEKQNMIEDTKMPRKANLEHYLNWTYIKKWHRIQSKPFGGAQRQKKNAHAHRYYIASNFLEIQDVYWLIRNQFSQLQIFKKYMYNLV